MANRLALADHLRTTGCDRFEFEVGRPVPWFDNGKLTAVFHPETLRNVLPLIPEPRLTEEEYRARSIAMNHAFADRHNAGVAKCYFIGAAAGLVKIGVSVDPPSRLKALQSGSPLELFILALAPGGAAREGAYHSQFSEHRRHGEWFTRCPEIEAEISRLTLNTKERDHG